MITLHVSHDGTLTRAAARMMREAGVPGMTGSHTLTQARKAAREAGLKCEFVQATRPDTRAKATRKAITERPEPTGYVRERIREASARKAALEALSDLAVA